MNKTSLRDLEKMNKTNLINLYLSLQEFTNNTLKENSELKEIIEMRRKLDFAASSEKVNSSLQMLFDELDIERDLLQPSSKEPDTITVAPHIRKKPHRITTLPAETPIIDVYHEEVVAACPNCGSHTMLSVSEKVVDRIGYQPAKRYIERHHYPQSQCNACEAELADGEKNIIVAGYHAQVDGLMAAPSMIAQSAVQKFADGLPLYRQSGIYKREGLEISRQTLSNWLLSYWQLLAPLSKRLREHIVQSHLINQDETPIKVLNPGPLASSRNNFMVVQVGTSGEHKAVLFSYVSNRRVETIDLLLKGYTNYVQTDGLKGYNHLDKHIGCWVHGVRAFKQILKVNKKAKDASKLCKLAGKLYVIEREERKRVSEGLITEQQFMISRRERAEVVFAEIKEFVDAIRPEYTSGSPMGKAVSYLYNYWSVLINYLNCYEATPSNNIAENSIRPFACGRRAWLFANTVNGADASALYYSLIETAKINEVNAYDYLWYVLEKSSSCCTEEDWDSLLPWNIDEKAFEKLKAKRDKAAPDLFRVEPYTFRGSR